MITQLDTENANYDLTTQQTVLTHTPNVNAPVLCQGLILLGDGVDNLDGTGGNFEVTVTVGGQVIEPDPKVVAFSTAPRAAVWTDAFPVPANAEVLLKIKSPNAGDDDVDVTASLHDVGVSANGVWDEVISKELHNVPLSAAKRVRQLENIHIIHEGTAQGSGTGDNTIVLAATASADDSWYDEDWLTLVEGTGAGQMRHVDAYDGTTKEMVVGEDWKFKPDATTDYIIVQRSSSHVHLLEAAALTQIVTTLMANAGFTAGGTMTFAEQLKIVVAWCAGNWRLKSGTTNVYQLFDADNGVTVILEMTLSQTTPYRTITVI